MAHGFEKLERLFIGSRRRERGRQKTTQQQQKTPIVIARQPSPPVFPSPSYLRPTSMQMMPRDAQIDGPDRDKGRSQSVPSLQEALLKRSSAASSITIVNNRPSRSDASTSSLRHDCGNSQTTSRSSRFRFPEDSLFKSDRPIRSSGEYVEKDISREQSPRARAAEHRSEKGLLDWTPQHISLLFNPLDFKASLNDRQWGSTSDSTESTLLPSPDFTPSMLLPDSYELVDDPDLSTTVHPPLPQCTSVQKLTLSLRQQSLSSFGKPLPDSPPTSESDEDNRKLKIYRSKSLHALASPHPDVGRVVSVNFSPMITNHSRSKESVRETWGDRLEDPRLNSSPASNNESIPRSRLIRKSASTSTLSVLTSHFINDHVLKEPTFDDFYALSDDDIAESRPPTPAHDARVPPTPPPKDMPTPFRKNRLPQALTSQNAAFKPAHDEITPPCTPTNSHLLALTYSPTTPLDSFGALWAAKLARKYDFVVLYILSLWPIGGDSCLDVSTNTTASEPRSTNTTLTEKLGTSAMASKTTGRLLAAYGLNEVPSPFEIATETHLAALDCDHWNEYRNIDARPDDISRGWIRPFYSDYTPVSGPAEAAGTLSHEDPKNRGIVFAAYSKQISKHGIPTKTSAEQELLLQQLYSDAKDLVEALVQHPSEPRKAPGFCQDFENSDSKTHLLTMSP
ncbi:hypothetical protein HD806DRAFT_243353 [Xylariaceae sp. AK1471]|nr:hypothetical protein HD806DRAFT_243353 [Xylariaceae sp. AK1471]